MKAEVGIEVVMVWRDPVKVIALNAPVLSVDAADLLSVDAEAVLAEES